MFTFDKICATMYVVGVGIFLQSIPGDEENRGGTKASYNKKK